MLKGCTKLSTIDAETFRRHRGELGAQLGELQRAARSAEPVDGRPPAARATIVIVDGWDAAGKGGLIGTIIKHWDPRGFDVHAETDWGPEERLRPRLWKYWRRLPAAGEIAVFDQGWYADARRSDVAEIRAFERQLCDSGVLIIKLFLHIGRAEQKRRFRALAADQATAWRVTKKDEQQNTRYGAWKRRYSRILSSTSVSDTPWVVLDAHRRRPLTIAAMAHIVQRMTGRPTATETVPSADAVDRTGTGNGVVAFGAATLSPDSRASAGGTAVARPRAPSPSTAPLVRDLTAEQYDEQLETLQARLRRLAFSLYTSRVPVIIAFEGWDAGGKGGAIKRLTRSLDPRSYRVIPVAAPTAEERRHHYLWRFWRDIPKGGHIAVFDRSWYGRVLVERVEGFCSRAEWQRAYNEIVQTEAAWLRYGAVVLKFWMHIDPAEQLARFEARQNDPAKQWKITDEDWRNREKWDQYEEAVETMVAETHRQAAPWVIVPGNAKWGARITVLEAVADAIEAQLRR